MNSLQRHHIEYLLSQIEDNDLGVELCLQHITGQELLKQRRTWQPVKDQAVRKLGLTTLIFTTIHSLYIFISPNALQITVSIAATTTIFLVACLVHNFIIHRRFMGAIGLAILAYSYMTTSLVLPAYNLGQITATTAIFVLAAGSIALSTSTVGAVYAATRFAMAKVNT